MSVERRSILRAALGLGVLSQLRGEPVQSAPIALASNPEVKKMSLPNPNVEINALPVQYDYDLRVPLTEAFTGADGGFSTTLPDRRTLVVYSDTVKGGVQAPDARGRLPRRPNPYIVNNTAIIVDTEKGTYSVLSGPKDEKDHDTSWIVPPQGEEEEAIKGTYGAGSYYWTQTPIVDGGKLYVPVSREVKPVGKTMLIAGVNIGIDIARFDLSGEYPVLEEITTLPRHENPEQTGGIAWGAGIVKDPKEPFTYVYGSKRQPDETKELYVARVPEGALDDLSKWQFWQKNSWTSVEQGQPVSSAFQKAESQATTILGSDQGLSAGFSVDVVDNKVVLVTKELEFLTDQIVAFTADTFTGPWNKRSIYTVPDHNTGPHAPDPNTGQIITYLASLHPEATNPHYADQMLLTYCKNVIPPPENPTANTLIAHMNDAELSRTESVWIAKEKILGGV
jgi:hypothetical protein